MIVYKKFIRPMMLCPASAQDYTPQKIPVEAEEKWYPEKERDNLIKKYKHFETTFETLVFEEKYEEVETPKIVRCKDCKHRPTVKNLMLLEFPNDCCPCQCEDSYYSWYPKDDFFCAKGERRNSN